MDSTQMFLHGIWIWIAYWVRALLNVIKFRWWIEKGARRHQQQSPTRTDERQEYWRALESIVDVSAGVDSNPITEHGSDI